MGKYHEYRCNEHIPFGITHLLTNYPLDYIDIPSTVTHIRYGCNQPICHLPPNIKKIVFGPKYNQPAWRAL